ncbi:MAG TPA: hypothetical protein VHD32_00640 [Candidatus Didemnitutus sp.]|nr:hypothetical protein [Candidatus Didemnitutus sp.]
MKTAPRFRSSFRRSLGFTHGSAAAFRAALRRVVPSVPRATDGDLGALWDPNLLDRLHMPLTRHPY